MHQWSNHKMSQRGNGPAAKEAQRTACMHSLCLQLCLVADAADSGQGQAHSAQRAMAVLCVGVAVLRLQGDEGAMMGGWADSGEGMSVQVEGPKQCA